MLVFFCCILFLHSFVATCSTSVEILYFLFKTLSNIVPFFVKKEGLLYVTLSYNKKTRPIKPSRFVLSIARYNSLLFGFSFIKPNYLIDLFVALE